MADLTKRPYHHGALREELVRACLRLIETEGIGAVSLRRVAKAAKVSHGAPYHHFPDRAALLGAISADGFVMLTERLHQARAAADGPVAALGAMLESYVAFAREHPAHFQLMFRPELSEPEKHPDAKKAGDAALQVLAEVVRECRQEGAIGAADETTVVAAAWALSHGLASLAVDGKLLHSPEPLGESIHSIESLTPNIARLVESVLKRG